MKEGDKLMDTRNKGYAVIKYLKEGDERIYLGYRVASADVEGEELQVIDNGISIVYKLGKTTYIVSHKELFSAIYSTEEGRQEQDAELEHEDDEETTDQAIYREEKGWNS